MIANWDVKYETNISEIDSQHKKQHDRFTDKILELKNRLTSGTLLSNDLELNQFFSDLIGFLRLWLTNHILQEDMNYKPFIKHNL